MIVNLGETSNRCYNTDIYSNVSISQIKPNKFLLHFSWIEFHRIPKHSLCTCNGSKDYHAKQVSYPFSSFMSTHPQADEKFRTVERVQQRIWPFSANRTVEDWHNLFRCYAKMLMFNKISDHEKSDNDINRGSFHEYDGPRSV
jgi:hypothetical protein